MLISLIVAITSECIQKSKHQVVHLKYLQFLFINYASVKQKKKNDAMFLNNWIHGYYSHGKILLKQFHINDNLIMSDD